MGNETSTNHSGGRKKVGEGRGFKRENEFLRDKFSFVEMSMKEKI